MKIGLVQYSPAWEDKEANKNKLLKLISRNLIDVSLLIFPEMTLTGFTMKSNEFAEKLDGDSFNFFSEICKRKSLHCFAGIIEKENDNIFNSLIHINNKGELVTRYRKIHPFSYGKENENYSKGKNIKVAEVEDFKIGLSICYDLRFPELYRLYAKERVDALVAVANWPDTRIEHWTSLLKARAIENQCYAIGVNRVGKDPKLNYTGFSGVYDPMGKKLASIELEEKIIVEEIVIEKVLNVRNNLPFLNDISLI